MKISHGNGRETRYAHMQKFAIASGVGTKVKAGDVIGYIGTTGLSTGPHLHFELYQNSEAIAQLLATHGALAVGKAAAQAKVRNLNRALQTSREIGMAMGIIMALHKVTREQAFDLLRVASQQLHRKLAEIATEVVDTGALPSAVEERR